jgi:hypothetical protein
MQTSFRAPSKYKILGDVEHMTRAACMMLALNLLEQECEVEIALRKGRKTLPFRQVNMGQVAFLIARGTGAIALTAERYTEHGSDNAIALVPHTWIREAQEADMHGWDPDYGFVARIPA